MKRRIREFCVFVTNCFWPDVRLPEQTDAEALASDWKAVEGDMRRAFAIVKQEHDDA